MSPEIACVGNQAAARLSPGIINGRLWWEQSTDYWELPFYADVGVNTLPDYPDSLAAREQLFAIREELA